MKYPITPEYIDSLPNALAELFIDLERYVLEDICTRFKTSGKVTETAIELIRQLKRKGYSIDKVEAYIKKILNLTDAEFSRLWDDAIERNRTYSDSIIDKDTLLDTSFDIDAFNAEIEAIERQTFGALRNITGSLGFAVRFGDTVRFLPIAETYQRVLDNALMRVRDGAASYSVAIREATKELTDSGLQTIDYESGYHSRVDVAARRAVMTGVTQVSAKYSEMQAEVLDTPYYEVSAHQGARDIDKPNPWSNHKKWQGKVYSVNHGDIYPNIHDVCGLGEVDGLTGVNCRHMYFPFVEGVSERTYTDEELANIDPPPFTYQGKQYNAYQATQMQRRLETAIRQTKREIIASKASGDNDMFLAKSVKLRRLKDEYESFSKAAGLRMQSERANIAGFGPKESRASGKAYNQLAKEADLMYDTGTQSGNIDAYLRDLPIRNAIKNEYPNIINQGRQKGHILGTNEYKMYVAKQRQLGLYGPSVITISEDELSSLYLKYRGTGNILRYKHNNQWKKIEQITTNDKIVGFTEDLETGERIETSCFTIIYDKNKGWHIVPEYADEKGVKGT